MIDMRKAMLLLPVYVAWMVGTDLLFNASGLNASNDLPLWLVIDFTIMAILVVLIVAWYLTQRSRGKVSPKRERAYMGFLIALIIWGFINDGLEAVVKMIFHSMSIWILIPFYILSYAILLTVMVVVMTRVTTKPTDTQG
ncbi:hypothetical protein [Mycobacterium intracellulare]|uniref:hypothetical protein n=1 Tax=Mycobacterium intracellulare TaxID=1767 RepID=UPI000AD6BE72|nr:hypothetical protein [Mycobacterium intracellulare]